LLDSTHKKLTRLERLARGKRSSLLRKVIILALKSFITLTTGVNVIKLFTAKIMTFHNKLERLSLASLYSLV
jgi:hypothetical protein